MISPNVEILTSEELRAREQAAYTRGEQRGRFEQSLATPHREAVELLEQGASLFFGRNPDMRHMDTPDFRAAHLAWFNRVSDFLRTTDQRATSPSSKGGER